MNDVMLPKPVKTHEKQVLPLIGTDTTDLKGENESYRGSTLIAADLPLTNSDDAD